MSGHVHYVKDLPGKIRLTCPPSHKPLEPNGREVLLDRKTFDSIGTYQTSVPTGPSAGRIYKRCDMEKITTGRQPKFRVNEGAGIVYIVINAPDGDGQLHVPYRAVIVEEEQS